MSQNRQEEITKILDAREGRAPREPAATDLAHDPDLYHLLEAEDLAWQSQHAAPPLADDPVAAMLGLVPDPEISLDGQAFSFARKRAGLTLSAVAERLQTRGWETTARDLFAWENGRALPRVPALIGALAEVVGVDADRLGVRIGHDPERARLAAVVASRAFAALAERWARLQGTTTALAASALESRMMVAVHRGGAPEPDVLLESIAAMVAAVEDANSQ